MCFFVFVFWGRFGPLADFLDITWPILHIYRRVKPDPLRLFRPAMAGSISPLIGVAAVRKAPTGSTARRGKSHGMTSWMTAGSCWPLVGSLCWIYWLGYAWFICKPFAPGIFWPCWLSKSLRLSMGRSEGIEVCYNTNTQFTRLCFLVLYHLTAVKSDVTHQCF
jgi:hypothetical protein